VVTKGGASAEMVAKGFRIILGDPNVKGVLINIFGGSLRCDVLANAPRWAALAPGRRWTVQPGPGAAP